METTDLVVTKSSAGKRLDIFLTEAFEGRHSRTYLKSLITDGKVHVDDNIRKGHYKLAGGEHISVEIPPPRVIEFKPENIPLDIIFEDDYILMVNKPAGMVVHPGVGNFSGTLLNALLYYCENLSGLGGRFKSGIVHRLDKDTSGIMVVAKDDQTHRHLAKQFKRREVVREYIAVVQGVVEFDEGIVDAPIARDFRDRKKMAVDFSGDKESLTRYDVIRRADDFTVLNISPKTGRTHQIRVHMKHIGHPILGDASYGVMAGISRQALHAKSLEFTHPHTGETVRFSAAIPEDIQKLTERTSLR